MPSTAFSVLAQESGSIGTFLSLLTTEWIILIACCVVIVAALVAVNYLTQLGIIARATVKEAVRQPVFILLIVLGIVLNVVNTFIPFFSLGEDVKMFIDCSLASMLIFGLLMASWTASTSIADEIEGKTAMTLLSKPINRRQFIIGKYLGILQATMFMLLPIVLVSLFLVYYKVAYDGKESSSDSSELLQWATAISMLPNVLMVLLEIAVMTAVSVAIATRLPMVVNLVFSFAVFVIGNLTPVLVGSGVVKMESVQFMARLIATVLPTLEIFNTQTAVATGKIIPPEYIGMSFLYFAAYSAAAICLALILFEDRDLA